MRYLLNLIYGALLLVLAPYLLVQSWRTGKYRAGWAAKLWGQVPLRPLGSRPSSQGSDSASPPCIWLHAVSLGEVNLLGTLIAAWRARRPDAVFYITTTTMTGYEAACRRYVDHQVSYAPLDFSWAVARAMRRIRPDLIVLAELELWPNLILAATRAQIPVAIANGRLSARSYRGYRQIKWLLRPITRRLARVAVQSTEYAERFRALGVRPESLFVTGSIKFDGAEMDRHNPRTTRFRQLAQIHADDVVWLAGSTFPPEEERVIAVYQQLAFEFPRLRLILVPRHPERFDVVAKLLDRAGVAWCRRSSLAAPEDMGHRSEVPPVLLVDTVGELGAWWGLAEIAYVGGSMGARGGQNMIEPAAYGAAVCFGTQTTNFRDVVQLLLADDAAVVVPGEAELLQCVRCWLADPELRRRQGDRARRLVAGQGGAIQKTMDCLTPLLPPPLPGVLRRSA